MPSPGFRRGPVCSLPAVGPHLSDSQGFPSLDGTIFDRQGWRMGWPSVGDGGRRGSIASNRGSVGTVR